jgi:hypothetical protein
VHPCHRIGDVRHHPHTMTIRFVSEFAEPSEHYRPITRNPSSPLRTTRSALRS